MDPLRVFIAACPLAVYLLMLGVIHLRRYPFVTTGARDSATIAIAIVGLVIVGPMELFFPEGAAVRFGALVWPLLLAFYGLCVSLVVLLQRPRIVIYNITAEQLRPILASSVAQMDNKARWTEDSLMIPSLQVHCNMEGNAWLRTVQLVAIGTRQNYDGWRRLERILRAALHNPQRARSVLGVALVCVAVIAALGVTIWMAADTTSVAKSFEELIWR
jgi:hypothetical protein